MRKWLVDERMVGSRRRRIPRRVVPYKPALSWCTLKVLKASETLASIANSLAHRIVEMMVRRVLVADIQNESNRRQKKVDYVIIYDNCLFQRSLQIAKQGLPIAISALVRHNVDPMIACPGGL